MKLLWWKKKKEMPAWLSLPKLEKTSRMYDIARWAKKGVFVVYALLFAYLVFIFFIGIRW